MNDKKYKVELSKIDIETIMDSLQYMTDGIRATLLKMNVSKEEFFQYMNELYAHQLYRNFLELWTAIERGDIE